MSTVGAWVVITILCCLGLACVRANFKARDAKAEAIAAGMRAHAWKRSCQVMELRLKALGVEPRAPLTAREVESFKSEVASDDVPLFP